MCGFAGELRVGDLADVEAVARMGATMTGRGPDGSGVWAIATQARTNPLLGYDGMDLLQRGYGAEKPEDTSGLGPRAGEEVGRHSRLMGAFRCPHGL